MLVTFTSEARISRSVLRPPFSPLHQLGRKDEGPALRGEPPVLTRTVPSARPAGHSLPTLLPPSLGEVTHLQCPGPAIS